MTDESRVSIPAERGFLAKVFVQPEEPRPRAGWRLLLHTIGLMVVFLGLMFAITLVVISARLVVTVGPRDPAQIAQDAEALARTPLVMGGGALLTTLVITIVTWVARKFLDRRTFVSLGLKLNLQAIPDLFFGIALGGLLMALIYAFEWAMGWLTFEGWGWEASPGWVGQFLLALLLYLNVGYYEELLSRGYHLQNLTAGLNLPLGLFLSSAFFSLLHLSNPGASVFSVIGILAAGYFLAFGWVRTGQLWISIGLHIGWNFFQGTIFGFPVSGGQGFHLIQQTVSGPEFVTGGAFGPEAGLTGLIAIGLGFGLIAWYTRGRQPDSELLTSPHKVQ